MGATYTATTSGDWSSSATWAGNNAPGANISGADQVVINSGVTVNLDQNVEVNGTGASLDVAGTLSGSSDLTITQGSLTGAGSITAGQVMLSTNGSMSFSGTLTCDEFVNDGLHAIAASVNVNDTLQITSGTFTLDTGSSMMLSSNATVAIAGGTLSMSSPGTFNGSNSYSVVYNGSSVNTGLELSGSGLSNVAVDLSGGNQSVTLMTALVVSDTLSLQNGELALNGNDLSANGTLLASGSASVAGSSSSNIAISTTGSVSGSLSFSSGSQTVNDFTCDVGSSGSLMLGSDLEVSGTFAPSSGQVNLNGNSFTMSGDISSSGSGSISANSSSNVTVSTSGSTSGNLTFASGGQTVNDLTVDVSGGGSVALGSDLEVSGTFSASNGELALNGNHLTISGDIAGSGSGSIAANSSSQVSVTSSGSTSGGLSFAAGSQTVGNLMIDISGSGSVALESDVAVADTLMLSDGVCDLNGNTLSMNANATVAVQGGSINVAGGSFDGSNSYHLVVNGSSSQSLGVEASGSGLTDVTIDLMSNSMQASVSNDMNVNGTLTLSSGQLALSGNHLMISGDVAASGSGSIAGSSSSNVTVNTSSSLSGSLSFAANSDSVNDLTIDVGSVNSASLDSDVSVTGDFDAQSGSFSLSGNQLTVTGDIASGGSGTITADASSDVAINLSGSASGSLTFSGSGNTVNDLSVDVGSGDSVALGSNVTISGNFVPVSGQLALNGNDLAINGSIAAGGSGSIAGSSSSNVSIGTSGNAGAELTFASGSQVVNDFTVDISGSSSDSVALGSDLMVTGQFDAASGNCALNGNDLTISGDIAAGGSGSISANGGGSVSVTTGSSTNGGLSFASGGQSVDSLVVDVGSNNSLALNSELNVSNGLQLTSGSVGIGNSDLMIAASASISGADTSSYVMTSGNGSLVMNVSAGSSDSTYYPVGTASSYAGAAISQSTSASSGMFSVNVDQGVLTQGNSGSDLANSTSVVDHTWFVEAEGNANVDMELTVEWVADAEVNGFNSDSAYISHYTNGSWDAEAAASASATANGTMTISRDGISSLSPFSVHDQQTQTGVAEVSRDMSSFEMYPNPATESIRIDMDKSTIDQGVIAIYSLTGQQVKQVEWNGQDQFELDITDLRDGAYIIRLKGDDAQTVGKFMKQ